jgi:hypothetical protein
MGEVASISKFIDAEKTVTDLALNTETITQDMVTYPGTFYHYSTLAIEARHAYDLRKAAHSMLEKEVNTEYRTSLKEENAKTTEAQIDAAASLDPRIKAGVVRLLNAKRESELAACAAEAFSQRRDMLLQIAKGAAREQLGSMNVTAITAAAGKERLLEAMAANAA